ncbi:MAG: c-type cytochrome [Steroidobacter sp.]
MRTIIFTAVALSVTQLAHAGESASGEELMTHGGCISCHRVDQKLLGPAFKDVATRYRGDLQAPARLFAKVREGGEGEWGDLPMQPNSEQKISDADLRALLEWILQL